MNGLVAEGLAVRIGGQDILRGVDIALRGGSVTAVVGPNGAGKSTLLACLAGLRRPDSGEVRLHGVSLAGMAARRRAQAIGFLPQTPEVAWAVDVETLVGLGRIPHLGLKGLADPDRAAVAKAMAAADVSRFARRAVASLSGGERARVLIARALAGEPQWLLADEPLAGLDPGHQLDAMALLRRLASEQGCGAIVTLHDLSLALRSADRVLVMARGGVLADAPPSEALHPDVIEQAYGVRVSLIQGEGGPLIEVIGRAGG